MSAAEHFCSGREGLRKTKEHTNKGGIKNIIGPFWTVNTAEIPLTFSQTY